MSSSRYFYGWWVTLAFAVMVFVSAGVRHAVGPFLKPMVEDLHVDRGSFSLVIALGLFLYGAFMPWVGGLADRFGSSPWSMACSPRSASPPPARWSRTP